MKPMKVAQFTYTASEELSFLFEDFRLMCNDALRIALEKQPRNRFELIELAYPQLKAYGLHTLRPLRLRGGIFALLQQEREVIPTSEKAFPETGQPVLHAKSSLS